MNEHDLSALEYSLSDQLSSEFVREAVSIVEFARENALPDIELEALVDDLNEQWRQAGMVDEVIVVGSESCWITASGDIDDQGYPVLEEAARMSLMADNVMAETFYLQKHIDVSESGVTSEYHMYLRGKVYIEDADTPSEGAYEDCSVLINQDTIVRYDKMTPDRAIHWLEQHFPDELAIILNACLSADDEAGALLNLRELEVDVSQMNKYSITELGAALTIFCESSLALEPVLPYLFSANGTIDIWNGESREFLECSTGESEFKQYMNNIELIVVHDESDGRLRLWVKGTVIAPKGRSDHFIARMPLSALTSFTSVRLLADIA